MEALKNYLKEVRLIPLLTAQDEVDLSKRIKKGDEQARKKMIRSNLRLVINIAKRYMYLGIPLLDLIEEGNLGLMRAVDKFNHLRGFRFSTYAAWWIKQGITRSISEQSKMIRVPVYMNELIGKWKKTKEQLSQKLKRVPSDEQIAKKMHISDEKKGHITFWLSATTSSLDAPVSEESESQIKDLVENEDVMPQDDETEHILDKERIVDLLGIMSSRERKVLDNIPHTLAEVAEKLGVSRERVRQIEEKAIKKLRKFAQKQEKE
jgi:RNA polymerase primary sigma factor